MPDEPDRHEPADRHACDGVEPCEDAEDARISRERLARAKVEGTVSWESIKAEYSL